mmetsp:Transcript_34756/g.95844  ORF Transcript_34756/g.95844 Transcript_34756/m.95844 type:complete len:218 (+) Transcript_34756:153-806(+)
MRQQRPTCRSRSKRAACKRPQAIRTECSLAKDLLHLGLIPAGTAVAGVSSTPQHVPAHRARVVCDDAHVYVEDLQRHDVSRKHLGVTGVVEKRFEAANHGEFLVGEPLIHQEPRRKEARAAAELVHAPKWRPVQLGLPLHTPILQLLLPRRVPLPTAAKPLEMLRHGDPRVQEAMAPVHRCVHRLRANLPGLLLHDALPATLACTASQLCVRSPHRV